MNGGSYLRDFAHSQPDVVALKFPAASYTTSAPVWDSLTYAELDRRSDAYANGFARVGVRPGDRTLVLVKPSLDFYCAFFGLMKLGAVPVLIDPGMGLKNVLACVADIKPRVVLAISLVQAVATFVRGPFSSAEIFITAGSRWFWGGPTLASCFDEEDEPFDLVPRDPEHDIAIVFTSGSTGTPKGVQWSQENYEAQLNSVGEMLGTGPGHTEVQCFAAFALQDVCWGQTCVIPKMDLSKPATADPRDIVAAIEAHEADLAFASPIVWVNVGRHCEQNGVRLPSLQKAFTTGAPIPLYVHRQFQNILSEGTEFWTPYGATEAIPVSHIATGEILGETHARTSKGAGTCVGSPAPGVKVYVVRITEDAIETLTEADQLPPGEIGELLVVGPNVSVEYKEKPEANRLSKVQVDGRIGHRMGDLGYLDDKGRIWFCGRKSHRLQTPDGMVPAVPVEGVFNDHPKVLRTALVGVGPRGREIPVLCVQMEPGQTFDDRLGKELEALAEDTPYAGLVQRFLPHDSFPVDARHNSKIRRGDLKPWAEGRCADLLKGAA